MPNQLKKNDRIPLKITGVTAEGSGVGHDNGLAVFVANAALGDTVTAHIIKVKKNYAVARIHQIVTPSPDRVKPDCPVFQQCGGCAWRHITYEAECRLKEKTVADALSRIGHLTITPQPILAAGETDGYRNKAQFPVGGSAQELKIGFFAPRSHRIVDCRACRLQPPEFEGALRAFARWIGENQVPIYSEETGEGLLRHIYLRKAQATGEVMACAVVNGDKIPKPELLAGELLREMPNLKSLVLNSNTARTNVVLGPVCRTLWGEDGIIDELCGLRFFLSPLSFYQVNRSQAERLYQKAAEYAALTGAETLLDLYCGTGTIGLTMAGKAKQVIGVEAVPEAVEDAKRNAALNRITNARFLCGDAALAARQLAEEGVQPDVIVLDPPRKGCDVHLIDTVVNMAPRRVVYVSCDPATLARDLKLFGEKGYETREATPVDLFPRTGHVETVVLLSHKKPDGHINVKVEFGEGEGKVPLDNIAKRAEGYKPKERVTYKMIKEYIEAKYGFKVHTAYIAEVKRDLGLPMYDAPNAVEELKQPRKHPTAEKVEAIKDALKHFEVI